MRALFLDKISTFSGEIRERVVPTELVWRRGNLNGLRSGLATRPSASAPWYGQALPRPWSVWRAAKSPRRLRETASSIRPACYRYTLCNVGQARGPARGDGPSLIAVRDPAKPKLEENAMSITVGLPPPRQPNQVPIWVECLVTDIRQ